MKYTLNKRKLSALIFSILFISSTMSYAKSERGGRRGAPPEAVEACENLSEGDSCSFSGRRGSVEGSCIKPQQEEVLACAPEGGPPNERGRPE